MSSLGGHIPDFETISMYSENGQSPIHRSSPWTKIAFLLLLMLIAITVQNFVILLIVYGIVLMAYGVAGLPKKKLLKWYLFPVFFVFMIALVFIFNEPGVALIKVEFYGLSLALTDAGMLLFMKLLVKSLVMVTFSFTLVMTTRYDQMVYLVKKLLPSPINSMFLLSYRFSFVVFESVANMLKAVHSRGGGFVKGILGKARLYGAILATSLINSVEKAERVGKAMQARGFSGELPVYRKPRPPSLVGVLFTALCAVMFLISYLWGFVF